MKKYKLKDVTSELHSGDTISAKDIFTEGDYPVFGGNGQRGYTNNWNQDGSYVIIGRQGAYCGNTRYHIGKSYLSEHAIVAKPIEGVNAIYLSELLSLIDLSRFQGQSAQPGLSVETISNVQIKLPNSECQNNIGELLLTIDRKIALNREINRNLEAMARQLYDYWFVQFDFPDENGRPYKSSGGKMAWNDKLKREIPEGWIIGSLPDIAVFTNGIACQKFRPENNIDKLPVIKIREMRDGITDECEWVKSDIPDSVRVHNGDILFSWSASLEVMIWCNGEGGLNQHIFKVISKNDYPQSYIFFQILDYIGVFKSIAEARKTTMGHITQDHLNQSAIVLPDSSCVLTQFEKRAAPIFQQYVANNVEISLVSLKKC